ncbi:MAG: hypothetical protein GY712_03865 [Oceanicoccus sp.]|uniref:hypothetical protein n=1 Tax=Oceanicoccus sp. TaxID=2691044 RepID=UPI002613B818|nr:hypothetical protein [Oceanicoccus sp.]MCP3907133.1 hypothetical protein [Oceanicoccus sp.]MDG1772488.1 hypothetical protein [Oceanicoccus sp.]
MNDTINKLLQQIRELEQQIEEALYQRAEQLRYRIYNGRVIFEREVLSLHRSLKVGALDYIRRARWAVILTAPVIYSLIVPFVVLDIAVSLYQAICFPIYNIPKVKRSDFLSFDRFKLRYLNSIEKINCAYCSYGNGIAAYVQEVAARTEQYWCPIKNAKLKKGMHHRYCLFTDYGDAEQYRQQLKTIKQNFSDND